MIRKYVLVIEPLFASFESWVFDFVILLWLFHLTELFIRRFSHTNVGLTAKPSGKLNEEVVLEMHLTNDDHIDRLLPSSYVIY